MPLSYAKAFDIAQTVRRNLPHFQYRDGVERAAALAAVEADDSAAAIGDTFKAYRIVKPIDATGWAEAAFPANGWRISFANDGKVAGVEGY